MKLSIVALATLAVLGTALACGGPEAATPKSAALSKSAASSDLIAELSRPAVRPAAAAAQSTHQTHRTHRTHRTVQPARVDVRNTRITAIGDSVMKAAEPALERRFRRITVDAAVSRQMWHLDNRIDALRARGRLGPVVVIALGTNSPFARTALERQLDRLGKWRTIVLVTTATPRSWSPEVNRVLRSIASRRSNTVVADWNRLVRSNPGVLYRDGTHPRLRGARMYARLLERTLQKAASSRHL